MSITYSLVEIVACAPHRLLHHPEAIAYLEQRGITPGDIDRWGIGYWDRPATMLTNRVIFPVFGFDRDTLVAVSGRVVEAAEQPKYWNTPFEKRRWLYGLWNCEVGRRVVLVESQMDAVALGRVGVQALATMGSSLSPWQAAAVRYFTDEVIVWPHADKPQQGPEWVGVLQAQGCRAVYAANPYPAWAPKDADADWMVAHCGVDGVLTALNRALDGPDLVETVVRQLGGR